jgi:hypothetical protein
MENYGLVHLLLNNNKPTDMELWFRLFLVGLETRVEPDKPNSVFYDKNNETLFELSVKKYGERYFYVKYGKIWSVFELKFGLNYFETQQFIKNVVEDTLNIEPVIPFSHSYLRLLWWKIP